MCSYGNSFRTPIAQMKFAKEHASGIFANLELPMETAMASLSRAWEMLFDSLCTSSDGSIDGLKDISVVIQKLSISSKKIQEMEFKQIEKLKCASLDEERQKLQAVRENLQNAQLPRDIVKTVEEQLQLL